MKNLVVLTGFRATGKTQLLTSLAKQLHGDSADTDALVVKLLEKPISAITAKPGGWVTFRKAEQEVLCELLNSLSQSSEAGTTLVLSTGGGLFTNDIVDPTTGITFGEANCTCLTNFEKKNAPQIRVTRLLLTADFATIVARMAIDERKNPHQRPGFTPEVKTAQAEPIEERLRKQNEAIFKTREPLYRNFVNNNPQLIIDTTSLLPDEVVAKAVNIYLER